MELNRDFYEDEEYGDNVTARQESDCYKIRRFIENQGKKKEKKMSFAQQSTAESYLDSLQEGNGSLVLKECIESFLKEVSSASRILFPVAIPLEEQDEGLLTVKQLRRLCKEYKYVLKERVPGIMKCPDEMFFEMLTKVDVQAFAWLLTDIWLKKITKADALTFLEKKALYLYMHRYFLEKVKELVATLERDPEQVSVLYVHPNVPKFAGPDQGLEIPLEYMTIITYNTQRKILGALSITDELRQEELISAFARESAMKSHPHKQNVHVLYRSTEKEAAIRLGWGQKMVNDLLRETWAHDEQGAFFSMLTKTYFNHVFHAACFREDAVKCRFIDEDMIGDNDDVVLNASVGRGLFVDTTDPIKHTQGTLVEYYFDEFDTFEDTFEA